MDSKIKMRRRKGDPKVTVDYSKVMDRDRARYELLKEVNNQYECYFFVDTKLGKASDEIYAGKYKLGLENDREHILGELVQQEYPYMIQMDTHQRMMSVISFPINSGKNITDVILGVQIKKGQLSSALFDLLMCTYDVNILVDPTVSFEDLKEKFTIGAFRPYTETKLFRYTIIDSRKLMQWYTDYPLESG